MSLEGCKCVFPTKEQRNNAQFEILKDERLALPTEAIKKAIDESVQDNWVMKCDCEDKTKIISAAHYEHNDWYLCTIKNAITRESYGGKGLGTKISEELMNKMDRDNNCYVYGADIDYDNEPSKRIWEKQGFKSVNKFKYNYDGKSDIAHVWHYVKIPSRVSDKEIIEVLGIKEVN